MRLADLKTIKEQFKKCSYGYYSSYEPPRNLCKNIRKPIKINHNTGETTCYMSNYAVN